MFLGNANNGSTLFTVLFNGAPAATSCHLGHDVDSLPSQPAQAYQRHSHGNQFSSASHAEWHWSRGSGAAIGNRVDRLAKGEAVAPNAVWLAVSLIVLFALLLRFAREPRPEIPPANSSKQASMAMTFAVAIFHSGAARLLRLSPR